MSSYAVFSVPDARFSSKIPVFALSLSRRKECPPGTPLRFAAFRPLPLPLCGGAQAPWRASSLRLRLRSELSDGFSLPFRLKRVFALVSATFLCIGFCSCPVFLRLAPLLTAGFFSIPGDKEKPAPARTIVAEAGEMIGGRIYTFTLKMALCILPVPISGAWAVSGSKVIASPGFTVTVVQSLSL